MSSDYATTESEVEYELNDHTEWVKGRGGRRAHAAYEFGGTAEHPVPRIRITIESPVTTSDEEDINESDTLQAPRVAEVKSDPALSDADEEANDRHRSQHSVLVDMASSFAAIQADGEADAEADWEGDSEAGDGDGDGDGDGVEALPPPSVQRRNSLRDRAYRDTPAAHTTFDSGHSPTSARAIPSRRSSFNKEDRTPLASPAKSSAAAHQLPRLLEHSSDSYLALDLDPKSIFAPTSGSYLASSQDEDLQTLRGRSGVRSGPRASKTPGWKPRRRASSEQRKVRRRQVLIPLLADAQFLDLFTQALVAVQSVQSLQRTEFVAATERLTKAIGEASSPYGAKSDLYAWRDIFQLYNDCQVFESTREKDAGELDPDESERRLVCFANRLYEREWLQGPITPSRVGTKDVLPSHATSNSASGLAWKHDSPSTATITQGRYAGTKLSPRSGRALTDFLTLNVALLDVKKYQRLNLEAARKILKKHDKRTALTAGTDLRAFMAREHDRSPERSVEAFHTDPSVPTVDPPPDPVAVANALAKGETEVDQTKLKRLLRRPFKKPSSSNVAPSTSGPSSELTVSREAHSTTRRASASLATAVPSLEALLSFTGPGGVLNPGKESESLAHILFMLMSGQLMPILPSLDDYQCSICLDVAWRPIRLDCGHLFCIRCLVKLQKQGRRACPLCRALDAVGSAGERNLDSAMTNMLKVWFPREVRAKERENEQDRRQEERKELGIVADERCLVM